MTLNLEDLVRLLEIARDNNCDYLVAKTPHGTYTFAVADIEIGLNTGNVVLRLEPVEDEA